LGKQEPPRTTEERPLSAGGGGPAGRHQAVRGRAL